MEEQKDSRTHCGHDINEIETADEGTSYCRACEREARMTLAEHFKSVKDRLDRLKLYGSSSDYHIALASLRAIAEMQEHSSTEGDSYDCACLYSPEPCNCPRAEIMEVLK